MLIGIAGPKRSGKDTLAQGLSKELGLPVDSFAAPLRKFVAELLNCSMATLDSCKEHPIKWLDGATPRSMMQTVGTEWGREMVHPELWVRSLFHRLGRTGGIISDVRFPNEAREIRARGGVVIALTRPGTGVGDAHVSEKPLDPGLVNVRLENDKGPRDLVLAALQALAAHGLNRVSMDPPAFEIDDLLAAESHVAPQFASGGFVGAGRPFLLGESGTEELCTREEFERARGATGL